MKKQLLFYGLLLCSLSLVPSGKMSRADMKAKVYEDLSNFGVEGGHKGPALIGSALPGLGRMQAELARIPVLEQQVGTIAGLQAQVNTIAGLQAQVDTIAGLQAEADKVTGLQEQVAGHSALLAKAVAEALEVRDGEHATALSEALGVRDGEHATALSEALAAKGHEHATALSGLQSQVADQLATIEGLQSRHGDEQARLRELLVLFTDKVVNQIEYDGDAPEEGSVAWLQRQLADKIVEANGVVAVANAGDSALADRVVAAGVTVRTLVGN